MTFTHTLRLRHAAFAAAALLALAPLAQAQAPFVEPKQAAEALVAALNANDKQAMSKLLGADWRSLLPPDGVDPADKKLFLEKAAQALDVKVAEGRAEVSVGSDGWVLPIPIVRAKDGKWRFDTAGGREAILDRRIGANELSAMQAALAYVDAQREYAQADRNGDGILEYARKFLSSPGKRDGLIWSQKLGDESPMGEAFVPPRAGVGYHGYHFKILTAQGPKANGGARSYLIGNRLASGYALLAWPVQYGKTGVMSFIVNQEGKLFERDLGAKTPQVAASIQRFDPDDSWKPAQP